MDPPLPPPPTTAKLRLMFSYGGHILPRPRSNTLFYTGGDTRIISFPRHTLSTFSSFLSHLSSTLSLPLPFSLKYQLPHLPLDSLISLSDDDDLFILIEEHHRLSFTPSSSSPAPSRIRVFVFQDSGRPIIRHPKTESWFFDALKSAKIMHDNRGVTLECETQECNNNNCSSGFFVPCAPETLVLETSSSFGSTSSSASLTNLPPLRGPQCEENEAVLKDGKVKLVSSDTVLCDNTVSSIMAPQQTISYQDHVVHVSEARVNAESIEVLESKIPYISSGVIASNPNMGYSSTSFPQFNQVGRPHLQFVQAPPAQISPLHPSGLLSAPSCPHVYQQQPLQHLVYHPTQPCPVYLVPIGNIPPNTLPITAPGQASLNPNASFVNSHASYISDGVARSPYAAHDLSPQNYSTNNTTTSNFVHVPYGGIQQRETDIYPTTHSQSHSVSTTPRESPKCGNNLDDDDLAHVQIYKSQPPPPTLPSKYQTMTKTTTNLISEALAQLHVDSIKQQTETSQLL